MMNEKVGTIAGQIWNALNENGALNTKDLKKAAKVKNEKELFLGLGWLLREDKVTVTEAEKDFVVALN
ncbi:MAG: winged helix-turn-helix domain-containing protein [Bacteroidaceae bacterium]|nr:winged helix-turn-helix domain-containing protein [Bacteroidaceae bacterium]MBR1788017.1 winged helix-turn-helix domain-containing protein [Bacteroidaceae bacterium]